MSAERPSPTFESIAQKPVQDIVDSSRGKIRPHHPILNENRHVIWLEETRARAENITNVLNVLSDTTNHTVGPYLNEADIYLKNAHWTQGGVHDVIHGVPRPKGDGRHGE